MAKEPKEEIQEQTPEAGAAKVSDKPSTKKEYTLKPGEVYLQLVGSEDDYLITSRSNWDTMYSKAKDKEGKEMWTLMDEKKR